MEFLVMTVSAILLPYIVQFIKEKTGLDGKKTYIILAVLLALLYVGYTHVLSPDWQNKVWSVIGTIAYISHLIYENFLKPMQSSTSLPKE